MTTLEQGGPGPAAVLARWVELLRALVTGRSRARAGAAARSRAVPLEALQVAAELAGFAAFTVAGFLVGLVAGFVVLGVCLLVVGNVTWR